MVIDCSEDLTAGKRSRFILRNFYGRGSLIPTYQKFLNRIGDNSSLLRPATVASATSRAGPEPSRPDGTIRSSCSASRSAEAQ
jgi:hypothetical protein